MLSVLLLSGGASRRMGQNKSGLPMPDGQDLLSWQEQRLKAAGFRVVSRLQDYFTGFMGPLAGIHAALIDHPEVTEWLILPVDMPQTPIGALNQILEQGRTDRSLCCFEASPLPLYLPVTSELKTILTTWLNDERGPRSVYALVKCLDGYWVPCDGREQELTNINTPEDWCGFRTGAETV